MASKSLISLANIPVEDIFNYLTIVKGVSIKEENAVDTDYVSGIEANKIAKAATDENGELIKDRDTVLNALQLDGVDAKQYLKRDESTTLLGDTYKVSTILSDELKEVRDELYQLKSELAKQGYIKQNHVYDGFYDAFRAGEIRYFDDQVTAINGEYRSLENMFTVGDTSELAIGECMAIKDASGNMYANRITEVYSNQIVLQNTFGTTVLNETPVYKYAGSYFDGEFIFGKDNGSYVSADIMKTIMKDGKDRDIIQVLGEDTKGFASKLSNYYSTYGSQIRKVEFSLAYSGNPGAIRASVWKVDAMASKQNPKCELLGVSESVYPSSCSQTLSEVQFVFANPIKISAGATYLIALYAGGVNAENVWKIGGYADAYDGTSEQWFVDDTYYFDNEQFNLIPGSTDSYLALYLSKEVNVNIRYNNTGLYTCKEMIDGGFTRARVELRVNREGTFYVADDAAMTTMAGKALSIDGDDQNPFRSGDIVVIGNMFSQLTGECTNRDIQMTSNMYTPPGTDVYRMGYKVIAKCRRKIGDVPPEFSPYTLIELPLTAVIPGKEPGKEAISSDRLIFEAEIAPEESDRLLNTFHEIEIQVYWRSALRTENINTNPQYAGRILDLTVATDKSYNKADID